jgi:hypothetical protein
VIEKSTEIDLPSEHPGALLSECHTPWHIHEPWYPRSICNPILLVGLLWLIYNQLVTWFIISIWWLIYWWYIYIYIDIGIWYIWYVISMLNHQYHIYIYCEQNYPCSGYVVWLIVSEVLRAVSSVSIVHCRGSRSFQCLNGVLSQRGVGEQSLEIVRGY